MQTPLGTAASFDDYVLDFALAALRAGKRAALVTLVGIEGSSPRPLGAQMAVASDGASVGYLSGGCLERAVVAQALEAMEAGASRLVRYGRGSDFLDIQLPCGSAITLHVDVTPTRTGLEDLDRAYRARRESTVSIGPVDHSGRLLTRHYRPRTRLLVAGVGAAAVQVLRLGRATGLDTALLSPDEPTRAAGLLEGIQATPLRSTGHAAAFAADARTAVVLMFHDHDWEDELLAAALASEAFYIGAQGSRMVHAARRQRLAKAGFDAETIARIRGPAGLFHGGKNAGAVAASILAEIMEAEQHMFPSLVTLGALPGAVIPPPARRPGPSARKGAASTPSPA